MTATTIAAGEAMPAILDSDRKTPKKPPLTSTSITKLAEHYNSQLEAYNAAMDLHVQTLTASAVTALGNYHMEPWDLEQCEALDLIDPTDPLPAEDKLRVIELIRKQNHRLKRHIRHRSIELLMTRATDADGVEIKDPDGRSIGLSYSDILATLAIEFPEASTSPACLRWYVVHMRDDAADMGLPWPDLPQVRPRSIAKKAK